MTDKQAIKPTEAELNVLRVLWQLGPSTVRDVHQQLSKIQDTGYTTILKIMQIMHEKGLVCRDESARAHIYMPVASKEDMQSFLVSDLIKKAFDGSRSNLVLRALDGRSSKEDIQAIRDYLDQIEKGK